MLLSAKTGRVRETTPLRRLSHKFEEMKNRVIIHRLQQSSHQSYCTGDPQLYRYALNRKSVLGSSGRYRFPVPLQAHPPVPGGISCCSLPVLPVPEVQAGPVHAKPHHSSCFCHLHTAWVLRPSPLFFLFQETVRSVPGFLQKTPHSAWEFSHLSIILSKNGTKATKLLF